MSIVHMHCHSSDIRRKGAIRGIDNRASAQRRRNQPDDEAGVPRSIARVLDLFEIVLAERTCNLTAAANASELTPTTALRYLRALEARGYVDRDESGDFSAGPTILRIAASLRGGTVLDRLAAVAQPHLDAARTTDRRVDLPRRQRRSHRHLHRHRREPPRDPPRRLDRPRRRPRRIGPRRRTRRPRHDRDPHRRRRSRHHRHEPGTARQREARHRRVDRRPRASVHRQRAHRIIRSHSRQAVDALAHELRTNGEDFTS